MTNDHEKNLQHPAENAENQSDQKFQEDDAKRADTNIKSACGDEPVSEENRNYVIPPDTSCDIVEPRDPKAPPQTDEAYHNAPGKKAPANEDVQDYDDRVGSWGGPDNTATPEDRLRARTNIKSACGDEPISEENRNYVIPPDTSCDIVEPRDPKAPPQADEAYHNEPGKKAPTNEEVQDYDDRVGSWGGEAPAQSEESDLSREDRLRADTNIKSACGDEPVSEENRNYVIPPNTSCDIVEPRDPKAPPQADAAFSGVAGARARENVRDKDYDARIGSWGGQDTNTTPEDRRRARTNITPGGHPMFYPDAGKPRRGCPADPKAPPRAARYGAGRRAPADADLHNYDERMASWGGDPTHISPEDRRRARTNITPGGHPMFYPDAGQARQGEVPDPKAPPQAERYGAGRQAPQDDPYLQDYDDRIGTWGGDEDAISSERLDIEIKKRVYPMVESAIEGFRDRFLQKDQESGEDSQEKANMDFDSDAFNFDSHVVEKITAQTVQNIDGVLGLHTSFFDGITHRFADNKSVPGVQAKVAKDMARIRLRLILSYDAEKDKVFHTIKDKLTERINSMCGLTLQALQIDVVDIMTQEEYDQQKQQ